MPMRLGPFLKNSQLDRQSVHANTLHVNIIKPLFDRFLPLLEDRFPSYFRPRQIIHRKLEIQLEFPWLSKK